ncbi:uncharacterized protein EV420DRAFT_1765273 [Desarmillaria tabescens]|uniref:Uncharacterized protein n=1 Tax=Armillaria tabescens TaxID=1929756 RepID=A0AA39JSE7_ARMTA|nr:uncharacterized protein EV420DRAFT_1767765 [Desarmillaria tabescens]XP_060329109.1 uncharacterized protein EV420DRAFT_1765273 [Desarmillaria tabescens]KAK0446604.1 hypothetical protein EV420DRAFT_1767765 [Desarmillaria tabescens]KAK0455599.1 hypothetical protein EV420DRAFT_1765273 [Desarmillaria tabescens]
MTLLPYYKLLWTMIIFAAPITSMALVLHDASKTSALKSMPSQRIVPRIFRAGGGADVEPTGKLPEI